MRDLEQARAGELGRDLGAVALQAAGRDHGDVVAVVLAAEHEAEEVVAARVVEVGAGDAQDVAAHFFVERTGEQPRVDRLERRRIVLDQRDFVDEVDERLDDLLGERAERRFADRLSDPAPASGWRVRRGLRCAVRPGSLSYALFYIRRCRDHQSGGAARAATDASRGQEVSRRAGGQPARPEGAWRPRMSCSRTP